MKKTKVHKFAQLYPVRKDGDSDDISMLDKFKAQEMLKHGKRDLKPHEIVKDEAHVPNDAHMEEDGQAGVPSDYVDPREKGGGRGRGGGKGGGGKRRKVGGDKTGNKLNADKLRKRNVGSIKYISSMADNAWNDDLNDFGMFDPKPFDELMEDITSWVTLSGSDYEIFPFHVMKCSDYLWLVSNVYFIFF